MVQRPYDGVISRHFHVHTTLLACVRPSKSHLSIIDEPRLVTCLLFGRHQRGAVSSRGRYAPTIAIIRSPPPITDAVYFYLPEADARARFRQTLVMRQHGIHEVHYQLNRSKHYRNLRSLRASCVVLKRKLIRLR